MSCTLKKLVSLLLVLVMILSLLPVQAMAMPLTSEGDQDPVIGGAFDIDFEGEETPGEEGDDAGDSGDVPPSALPEEGEDTPEESPDEELPDEELPGEEAELEMAEDTPAVLAGYAVMNGMVVDSSGTGVPGVSVMLFDMTDGEVLTIATTSTTGSWTAEKLILGNTYRVRYHKPGYAF